MTEKIWSDTSLLKAIPNPTDKGYQISIENPEITFLGVPNQPDFATAVITFYPNRKVIELKSLKLYFQDFRNRVMSYERLANVVFDDISQVYSPHRLHIVFTFRPRGGIASKICIDSAWKVRGGTKDLQHE